MGSEGRYAVFQNLSKFHREHEKFYAETPLHDAARMHEFSKTLKTLADRWAVQEPSEGEGKNRYAGCEDLNEASTIQHDGLLFMEGEGEPQEVSRLKRDLSIMADDYRKTGEWLSKAMESSWEIAGSLVKDPGMAAVLGDRHRIIANDWLAADMSKGISRLLRRALETISVLDFSPGSLRKDLGGARLSPAYLYSSAEMIDRAADLAAESAALVHDNEYRWRRFRGRLAELTSAGERQGR